jgi:DNA-binding MarR family transcriptional regulator
MTAPVRTDLNHCACLALRQAARRVTQLYDHHLVGVGLRVTQFSMLARLAHGGPLSIRDFAAAMVMDRTTLTRNLKPLERDGLVETRVDPNDRRGRRVTVTAAGRARLAQAVAAWGEAQTAFEDGYGLAEAKTLHRMLRGVSSGIYDAPAGHGTAPPKT